MSRPYEGANHVARSVALGAALLTVLTGTGLFVRYQPVGDGFSRALTLVHLLSIAVGAQAIVVVGVMGLITSLRPAETARRVLSLAFSLVAFVIAIFTGVLLGWDQLALEAVTTGSDVRGYGWMFGNDVRFAIIDDTAVGVDTIQRLLIVHVGSAAAVAVTGIVIPVLLSKGPRSNPSTAAR